MKKKGVWGSLTYLLKILWAMKAWLFLGDIWDPNTHADEFCYFDGIAKFFFG